MVIKNFLTLLMRKGGKPLPPQGTYSILFFYIAPI